MVARAFVGRGFRLPEIARDAAVRLITATLKGPVAKVFGGLVPGLAGLGGVEFYDTVMASSELLHGCLTIFAKRRDAFAHLLVDCEGRRVQDDFLRLRCGRSIHDITAMVVRTHARRHFETVLGGDSSDPASPSGRLYAAINEYLIHHWQVPLVAHYAPLAVDTVRRLGPALLDITDAAALDALSGTVIPPALPARLALPAGVIPLPTVPPAGAGRSRDEDHWWETLYDPLVRATVGIATEREMREMVAAFLRVGGATRARLLAGLQLSLPQAAVVLATAYRVLGPVGFHGLFGAPGNPVAIAAIVAGLERKGVQQRKDLKVLAGTVEALVRSAATRTHRAA